MPVHLESCGPQNKQPWIICTLCFSVMVVMFLQRNSVSETLRLMELDEHKLKENTTKEDCPYYYEHCRFHPKKDVGIGHYWSREMVRASNQAFTVGYLSCQIPVGVVTDWRGPRNSLGVGVLLSSFICLTLPSLASIGPYWFMAGHFFMGIAQSPLFPSTCTSIAQWSSVSRRATFCGITIAGVYLGAGVSPTWFVLLLRTNRQIWRFGLYAPGLLGIACGLVWLLFSNNLPTLSSPSPQPSSPPPGVPPFLLSRSVRINTTPSRSQVIEHRPIDMPWRQILRSWPFLSLVAVKCGYLWFRSLIMTMGLELYLYHIQQLSTKVSRLSRVVLLVSIPTGVGGGVFSDWLVANSILSVTFSRKLFICLGNIVAAFMLLFIPLTKCNPEAYIGLIVAVIFISGLGHSAVFVNPIDLSPRHAGMLMGVLETLGGCSSILFRETQRILITDREDVTQWNVMYFFTVPLVVALNIPFMFFGSGEQQTWPIRQSTFAFQNSMSS